jgi:hypothetical protein
MQQRDDPEVTGVQEAEWSNDRCLLPLGQRTPLEALLGARKMRPR